MTLEKKDIRFKLTPDDKESLDAIADAQGLELCELVEQWVVGQIRREIHKAKVITERLARRGISGICGDGKRSV